MRNLHVNKNVIKAFVEKNPTATFAEFIKENPKVRVSDCYYYTLRRKVTGIARDSRRNSNVYIRLFLIDSKEIPTEAKNLLQKFLDAMNITHRSRMEMIEVGNPAQLEIRELKAV